MCSFLTFYLASFVYFTFIYISLSLSLRLHSFPLVCLYSNLNLFKRIIGSFSYPPTIVHYFSIYLQLANKLQLMSTTQILALLNLYLDGHVHINLLENFDWLFEKIKNKGKYERPYFKKYLELKRPINREANSLVNYIRVTTQEHFYATVSMTSWDQYYKTEYAVTKITETF